MQKDLSKLLSPNSIAVIGASRSPEKVGAIVLKNIQSSNFPGKVYPVNPNAENINDLQCFPNVEALPEVPDLAIIAIPAAGVPEILSQIGEKSVKNVVILSAGFKEVGEEGEKLEKQVYEIAEKYNLNLLGPNCLGFVNNQASLNATFGQTESLNGNLRFITQSGAIAASLFDWCGSVGLGFSQFVTLGNKTAINENDVLFHFHNNTVDYPNAVEAGLSDVNPIGLYLESVSSGSEFMRLAEEIGKKNSIFIIKPGKTKAAAKAMQSHTGAIAGEDDVFNAALNQVGVARCATLDDFFDMARAFSWEMAPYGPRVAIVSNAGGPAVISADAVTDAGLKLADFSEDTKNKLLEVLPRSASILNPVDVLGDALAERYRQAIDIILATDQADSLLIILTPQMMTQVEKTAQIVGEMSAKYKKPIFCSFIGGRQVAEGENILNNAKLPSFRFPERAIATIGAMWKWKERQIQLSQETKVTQVQVAEKPEKIGKIVENAVKKSQPALDGLEANEILNQVGILTPPTSAVSNLDEARNFANQNGWPVVLKISSPELLHKANVGGVVTDIWNEDQLHFAWDKLVHKIDEFPPSFKENARFQIQKDVTNGIEVIVGVRRDPTFGPVLLFGAGGELAELVADKNLKILPVDLEQVKQLVARSKVYKLLQGVSGEPSYALDKLYDAIIKLTQLVPLVPEASDIEINPVIVTHNDVWAVDAKVLLEGVKIKKPAAAKFRSATLSKSTVLASNYHYFEFETEEPFTYKPGQYISVKVSPTRINSYSIAGNEGDRKFFLLVDTTPGGPGSKFFENIKEGDAIAYLGPFGNFTLKVDDGAGRLLFLGTGSGCSPLRSMLEAALKNPDIKVPIHLYFGLRYSSDVFWKDYFEKLAAEHPNFHFHLVLSKPDEGWQGQVGHITDALEKEIDNAGDCAAYLCGSPAMIEEASAILKNKNCPEDRIYTEKF